MDVLVVAQRADLRWAVAAQLGLPPASACPPGLAASRLAHPSSPHRRTVLLLVRDESDVAWLRRQRARSSRVRVVAVVGSARLARVAAAAGAVVLQEADASAGAIHGALVAASAPGVVIDLEAARSA